MVVLIIGSFVYDLIRDNNMRHDQAEGYCKEWGFDKLTDLGQDGNNDLKLECDGKIQFDKTCTYRMGCLKKDKFGACLDNELVIQCYTYGRGY